ncbi:pur operon repressor [Natribacillus halophilus]|uniref:Purine operon repressor, PurR n=1 Tax=Natribacillus halophilus TaxID=549003 RepID=A0A1G8RLN9_9BACI|nr:pur operon repressor [Natribacillus halophilus]SDJ17290.1 purine operon repressor, PurR [Natribacillus halophilus]
MKKLKRSSRLVDMTYFLLQNPQQLISLSHFSERYGSAKSSISEDLAIIKDIFESERMGYLMTEPGVSGGIRYEPALSAGQAHALVDKLCSRLEDPERLLPGGYLYMMDVLGQPGLMNQVGRLFAGIYRGKHIDVVMTMATKGIPLAYAVASYLDVPVSIVRRDHRITEGSVVSINYVSGSAKRIQTMSLARRSIPAGSRVLIVDDFMKGGGTAKGMSELLTEVNAHLVDIAVLVEADTKERLIDDYISLVQLAEVNEQTNQIKASPGNFKHYLAD